MARALQTRDRMAKRIVLVDLNGEELFSGDSLLLRREDATPRAHTPNESGIFPRQSAETSDEKSSAERVA